MHYVYILYSHKLNKFYTGETADLESRMQFHNSGANKFTSKGMPWRVVTKFVCANRKEALVLEKTIKRNGARRYLERNNINHSV